MQDLLLKYVPISKYISSLRNKLPLVINVVLKKMLVIPADKLSTKIGLFTEMKGSWLVDRSKVLNWSHLSRNQGVRRVAQVWQ